MRTLFGILFIGALAVGCTPKDVAKSVKDSGKSNNESVFIGDYILQGKADIIINAMPGTNSEPYVVIQLNEQQGQNIQTVFGLKKITVKNGMKRESFEFTEMVDFGSDSPTLEGIVRNFDFSQADEIVIHFVDLTSSAEQTVVVKNVKSTVAY